MRIPIIWGAEQGELEKLSSWKDAVDRRRAMSAKDVEFVPFSIEAGGAWGPAAKRFFNECLELAGGERNVDLYHWSSAKFSSTWYDELIICLPWWPKGGLKSEFLSCRIEPGDWSKRIRDMQY